MKRKTMGERTQRHEQSARGCHPAASSPRRSLAWLPGLRSRRRPRASLRERCPRCPCHPHCRQRRPRPWVRRAPHRQRGTAPGTISPSRCHCRQPASGACGGSAFHLPMPRPRERDTAETDAAPREGRREAACSARSVRSSRRPSRGAASVSAVSRSRGRPSRSCGAASPATRPGSSPAWARSPDAERSPFPGRSPSALRMRWADPFTMSGCCIWA